MIVFAGKTYTWDPDTPEERARALWAGPAKRVYVAEVPAGAVAGPEPRRARGPGRQAGFMVAPTGAAAPSPNTSWPRPPRRATAPWFNTVVETDPAVALWTTLGFTILCTVPQTFARPRHGRVGLPR
ncbi:GNAT family N-acetyltransferase [Streptomyces shenzhenensis]